MRKTLLGVYAVVLIVLVSGCMTTPPPKAVIGAGMPVITGPESGYTGSGPADAHAWDDDDARVALWLRRNFPDRFGEVFFPLGKLFSYNAHHDRDQYMAIFDWDYYFADMDDPPLMIRMNTLEARDRNETRRSGIIAKRAAEKAAAEQAITGEVSDMTDRQVVNKLQTVFP